MKTLLNRLFEKMLVEGAQIVYVLTIIAALIASAMVCWEKFYSVEQKTFQSNHENINESLLIPDGTVQIVLR